MTGTSSIRVCLINQSTHFRHGQDDCREWFVMCAQQCRTSALSASNVNFHLYGGHRSDVQRFYQAQMVWTAFRRFILVFRRDTVYVWCLIRSANDDFVDNLGYVSLNFYTLRTVNKANLDTPNLKTFLQWVNVWRPYVSTVLIFSFFYSLYL